MTQPETGLRAWIAALEAAGELRRVKARVDWDGEIGAVTRANMALAGPALLFENIRGHGDTLCTRLMTCGLSTRKRVAMMADLPSDASDKDLVRHFRNRYRSPTAPVAVDDGPVKAHTLRDNQIDLGQFPAPRWHGSDGGRYIDSFCDVVTRVPSLWSNDDSLWESRYALRPVLLETSRFEGTCYRAASKVDATQGLLNIRKERAIPIKDSEAPAAGLEGADPEL